MGLCERIWCRIGDRTFSVSSCRKHSEVCKSTQTKWWTLVNPRPICDMRPAQLDSPSGSKDSTPRRWSASGLLVFFNCDNKMEMETTMAMLLCQSFLDASSSLRSSLHCFRRYESERPLPQSRTNESPEENNLTLWVICRGSSNYHCSYPPWTIDSEMGLSSGF